MLLLLAAVQFTHILDFMVMMPLGEMLMRELSITPAGFSHLVAAYTISAGVVGLLAAPFMDRFDRRKVLLITYAGFILGTLACALSQNAATLLISRAICGAFGGISGATVLAIVGDIVPPQRRATGMGIIMSAFAVEARGTDGRAHSDARHPPPPPAPGIGARRSSRRGSVPLCQYFPWR